MHSSLETICRSSSTTTSPLSSETMAFMRSSTATSIGLPATASRRSARWPRPRRTRSSAVATYLHSRTGSLSLSSSVTHATAVARPAHQSRTAVVLPYPAGAVTSVSEDGRLASRARRIRGRSTRSWCTLGTASFASTSRCGVLAVASCPTAASRPAFAAFASSSTPPFNGRNVRRTSPRSEEDIASLGGLGWSARASGDRRRARLTEACGPRPPRRRFAGRTLGGPAAVHAVSGVRTNGNRGT